MIIDAATAPWIALILLDVITIGGCLLALGFGHARGHKQGLEQGRKEGAEFGVEHGTHEERHRWLNWLMSQTYPPPWKNLEMFLAEIGVKLNYSTGKSERHASGSSVRTKRRGCRCAYCHAPLPHLPPDYGFAVCEKCQAKAEKH